MRRGAVMWSAILLFALLEGPAFSQDGAGVPAVAVRVGHPPIVIHGNAGFSPANGVTGGTGTTADPYRIEGWRIVVPAGGTGIDVRNTTASFVIRDVDVGPETTSTASTIVAVRWRDVANAGLEDSTLDDAAFGLYASESRGIRVTNTTFRIADDPLTESGLVLERSNDILLSKVEITGGRVSGLRASTVSNLTLEDSNFYRLPAWAVWAQDSIRVAFRGNSFLGNAEGIGIGNATNVVFESNAFDSNDDGIRLAAAQDVTLVGNEFLRSSGAGIALVEDSRFANPIVNVTAYHNRFNDNVDHARDSAESDVVWDAGYPDGGNFWSGFVAPDRCRGPLQDDCTNRDGLVDIPYTAMNSSWFLGNVDRYPLVRPYTDSRSPPQAALSVVPTEGDSDTTFELDATDSSDAEDRRDFLEARWDFDGDLAFDTDWSDHLTTSYRYPGPGVYYPRVEVRDTTGASSVSSLKVVVTPVPVSWTGVGILVWLISSTAIAVGFGIRQWRRRARAGRESPVDESGAEPLRDDP